MPPQLTGNMPNHLAPGIFKIVGTQLGGRESFYSQMQVVSTSIRNYEDALAATGLPIAVEKAQGEDIQSFDPIEGSTKRFVHKTYAIGFEMSEEAEEDDLYKSDGSMLVEASKGIADSLAERVELEAHRPFNTEGFSGTAFTVLPDSSTLFATSHNVIVGAQGISQGNRPSTNADFNITSYQAALTQFRRWRDDQGKRVPGTSTPMDLWVPPELEYAALEVVKSPARPDQPNPGVINSSGGRVNVKVNPYLDDTDSWFIKGSKHFVYFIWRWRPRMDSFDDQRKRVSVFVAYARFVVAPMHWLGYYGSPGE